jgi:hypothetical protein
MTHIRMTAAAAAATIALTAAAAPTGALAASHWSKSQCKSYVSTFHKNHAHATAAQKAAADKTLKGKGCSQKV